jgi:hypothetical protein
VTTTHDVLAGFERACAQQTPVILGGRRYRVTGLGACPDGHCSTSADCPGLLYLHTDDTGVHALALPAVHLARAFGDQREEYRLEIITDPDPEVPAALVVFRADGIAAAIATARRILAAVDGPADQYGELYQRNGELADFLTTIHLGA